MLLAQEQTTTICVLSMSESEDALARELAAAISEYEQNLQELKVLLLENPDDTETLQVDPVWSKRYPSFLVCC
jgi:hypothetical protein